MKEMSIKTFARILQDLDSDAFGLCSRNVCGSKFCLLNDWDFSLWISFGITKYVVIRNYQELCKSNLVVNKI